MSVWDTGWIDSKQFDERLTVVAKKVEEVRHQLAARPDRQFLVPLPKGWKLSVPAAVFGGVAGIMAIFTGWFALEAKLLAAGEPPITSYVRTYATKHVGFMFMVVTALGFGLGSAVAHFLWDAQGFKPKLKRATVARKSHKA